jgi:hypothetical protein
MENMLEYLLQEAANLDIELENLQDQVLELRKKGAITAKTYQKVLNNINEREK